MIHRGAIALVKSTWASWMQYRGFFFVLAFGWMVPPLVYLLVWSTAAESGSPVGFSRGALVAYSLTLIVVNQFTYAQTNWTVGDFIRGGQLNTYLLRPMPYIYQILADEAAGKVVFMAFVIPVSAVLALVLRPELHLTLQAGLLFLPALALAWCLRFLWGLWLAMLAFWATRADALLAVQDALTFLLAGIVAPVVLLPDAARWLADVLPFRYMVGFPVEILTGQVQGAALRQGFAVQAGWLLLAFLLCNIVWKYGLRRYTAVGG